MYLINNKVFADI